MLRSTQPVLLRDAALALGAAVLSAAFAWPSVIAVTVAVAMCAPLAVRRTHPRPALAALTVAAAVQVATLDGPGPSIVAVPVLLHSLARWSGTADARAGLAVGLAGSVIGPARWLTNVPEQPTAGGWATTIAAYAGVIVAAYVAGRRAREAADRDLAERERVLRAATALLRALGLQRRQLRWMLAGEAVLLSLAGIVIGTAAGMFFGWVGTRAVSGELNFRTVVFSVSVPQTLAVAAVAVAAGVLASVLPGRRAARAVPVEALAEP